MCWGQGKVTPKLIRRLNSAEDLLVVSLLTETQLPPKCCLQRAFWNLRFQVSPALTAKSQLKELERIQRCL